jgi:hypothetical protein
MLKILLLAICLSAMNFGMFYGLYRLAEKLGIWNRSPSKASRAGRIAGHVGAVSSAAPTVVGPDRILPNMIVPTGQATQVRGGEQMSVGFKQPVTV